MNRPPRFTIARFARPVAGAAPLTKSVLTDAQMTQVTDLARAVETAYCKVKARVLHGRLPLRLRRCGEAPGLDMEFKFLLNGHFVLKQSREFSGQ